MHHYIYIYIYNISINHTLLLVAVPSDEEAEAMICMPSVSSELWVKLIFNSLTVTVKRPTSSDTVYWVLSKPTSLTTTAINYITIIM